MTSCIFGLAMLALVPPSAADPATSVTRKEFRVPYRLTNTNHVLVRVKFNGKGPYNFILDTGAPALFVSTALSRKLGVEADADGWGSFPHFEIEGGVEINPARGRVEDPFQLEGMNGLGLAGAELHGIIGYNILARYRLDFDFTDHKMGWRALDYEPPPPVGLGAGGSGTGMDALGGVMKLLGGLLGKKTEPKIILRGFLGVLMEDKNGTVIVTAILPKSPASASGLQVGDQVQQVQSRDIQSTRDVHRLTAALQPEESATWTVKRGDTTQTIRIKAGRGL